MEEEGTIVYFKTSPLACELTNCGDHPEAEDLLFEDEVEILDREDDLYTASASSLPVSREPAQRENRVSIKVESWNRVLWVLLDLLGVAKRWLFLHGESDRTVKYRDELLDCIVRSPLLTEDDLQLVQFITSNGRPQRTRPPHPQLINHQNGNRTSFIYIVSMATFLCGIVISMAAVLLSAKVIISACAVAMAMVGGVLVARWWQRMKSEEKLSGAVLRVRTYLREFESLLSLINQTARLVRETEIISHGYSRPLSAVPIAKLETIDSPYYCPLLRKQLFKVCQDGVCSLRRATCQLCTRFTSCEEFDRRGGYLAFRGLATLHQFMEDEGERSDDIPPMEEKEEREGGPHPSHSLESLKDACNLLAVQNSEMLRRLVIVAGFTDDSCYQDGSHSMLPSMADCLAPLCLFVHQARSSLQWSVDYHKNYLFGEPPTNKRVPLRTISPNLPHPLDVAASEVHCMDLKAQVALQRIRELGSWMSDYHGGEMEEGPVSITTDVIDSLHRQLSAIEQVVHGMEDHLAECYRAIQNNNKEQDEATSWSEREEMTTDVMEEEEAQLPAEGAEQECSDDEVVFEAYVSPMEVTEDKENFDLCNEDAKKESKENSLRMMKELNSVLEVRNVKKQQKRELKQREKLAGHQSIPPEGATLPQCSSQVLPQALPTLSQCEAVSDHDIAVIEQSPAKADGGRGRTRGVGVEVDKEEEKLGAKKLDNGDQSEDKTTSHCSREQLSECAPPSAGIAEAVAAAALRAGRTGREEVFHDEDSSPSEEEKEEQLSS